MIDIDILFCDKWVIDNRIPEVKNGIMFTNNSLEPDPEGLLSYQIFGLPGTVERKKSWGYIDLVNNTSNSNNNSNKELVKVITQDGLTVREQPGTDKRVLTYISYNEIVTRVEAGVSTANGYTWDKIVTGSGVVGYIARGNSSENFIESIGGGNNNQISVNTLEECDIDSNNVVNSADLYHIIKFLKENPDKFDTKYDVNKDSKINSGDLYSIILYLKQH